MLGFGRGLSGRHGLGGILFLGMLVALAGCHETGPATIVDGSGAVVDSNGPDVTNATMVPVNGHYVVYAPTEGSEVSQPVHASAQGRTTKATRAPARMVVSEKDRSEPLQAQEEQQAPAPIERRAPEDQGEAAKASDSAIRQGQSHPGEGTTAQDSLEEAEKAPSPPLPVSGQKQQAAGSHSAWTPGHWGHGSEGYFWVPGAWSAAP